MVKQGKTKKNIFANKRVSGITFALIIIILGFVIKLFVGNTYVNECKSAVKGYLKAPSTAIFYNLHEVDLHNNRKTVKGSVESQNGFGAMGLTYFYCDYIGGKSFPIFKDNSDYMYEYYEEIERTGTGNYEEIKTKAMYAGKDILESCEQFVKEYYGEDTKVYATKSTYLNGYGVKGYSVDFHINYNGTRIEGTCSQNEGGEYGINRNGIFAMTINGKTITEYDLK